jgi:hypothetical protein
MNQQGKWAIVLAMMFLMTVAVVAITIDRGHAWDPPSGGGWDLQPLGASGASITDFVLKTGDTMSGTLNMGNQGITNIDWSASDDGTDSGLDADLLDGEHGSYYMSGASWVNIAGDTMTGALYMGATALFSTANGIQMTGSNQNFIMTSSNDIHLNSRSIKFDNDDTIRFYSPANNQLYLSDSNNPWIVIYNDGEISLQKGLISTFNNNDPITLTPHGTGAVEVSARITAAATTGPLNLGGSEADLYSLGDDDVIIGGTSMQVGPAVKFEDVIYLPKVIGASITEPVPCNSASESAMIYADDTDDTAYARICVCANLDGTGYDWRDSGDIVGTACPFF